MTEGRTNREVAAALVLSENTVESHLRSVYRKLGIRSRVELARRLQTAQCASANASKFTDSLDSPSRSLLMVDAPTSRRSK